MVTSGRSGCYLLFKLVPEEFRGIRSLAKSNLFGSSLCNKSSSAVSAFRPQINNIICGFYKIKIMLDNKNCITCIYKLLKYISQMCFIAGVKSRSWLIKNIEGLTGGTAGKLCRKLDSLRLAARYGSRRLTYLYISESDIIKRFQLS